MTDSVCVAVWVCTKTQVGSIDCTNQGHFAHDQSVAVTQSQKESYEAGGQDHWLTFVRLNSKPMVSSFKILIRLAKHCASWTNSFSQLHLEYVCTLSRFVRLMMRHARSSLLLNFRFMPRTDWPENATQAPMQEEKLKWPNTHGPHGNPPWITLNHHLGCRMTYSGGRSNHSHVWQTDANICNDQVTWSIEQNDTTGSTGLSSGHALQSCHDTHDTDSSLQVSMCL